MDNRQTHVETFLDSSRRKSFCFRKRAFHRFVENAGLLHHLQQRRHPPLVLQRRRDRREGAQGLHSGSQHLHQDCPLAGALNVHLLSQLIPLTSTSIITSQIGCIPKSFSIRESILRNRKNRKSPWLTLIASEMT